MNALFGDATTALGTPVTATPSVHAESDSLVAPGSPVPRLDLRGQGYFGAAMAIPGLNIDPPDEVNGGRKPTDTSRGRGNGLGGWLSRLVGNRGSETASCGGQYARLDEDED